MGDGAGTSSTPALDKLDDYVRRKKQKEKAKIKSMYVKRDVEKAHAQYLRTQRYSHLECDEWNDGNLSTDWRGRDLMDEPSIRRRLTVVEADPCRKPSEDSSSSDQMSITGVEVSTRSRMGLTCPGSRNMTDEEILLRTIRVEPVRPIATYFCPVENCSAGFSNTKKLKGHLTKFDEHSPCHPYKHIVDLELNLTVKEYRCPTCFSKYKSLSSCMTHMMALDHNILELYKPVGIAAYACPECFLIYLDIKSCRQHIAEANHVNYRYHFEDDPAVADPLLLSPAVLEQYLGACREAEYHLECIQCCHSLHPAKDSIRHHLKEGHTVIAFSEKSLEDIFGELQRRYTCACCQMLFKELPAGGLEAVHQCSDHHSGLIVENNCTSSTEFMLRLALHRPASTKAEFPNCLKTTPSTTNKVKGHNSQGINLNQMATLSIKKEPGTSDEQCEAGVSSGSVKKIKCSDSVKCSSARKRRICEMDDKDIAETKKYKALGSASRKMNVVSKLETSCKPAHDSNQCSSLRTNLQPEEKLVKKKLGIIDEKRKLSARHDIDLTNLSNRNHVLFLDLDECSEFFHLLTCPLPEKLFVWAFCSTTWEEPSQSPCYQQVVSSNSFYLQREAKRDSLHIKMALAIGRMDERLPEFVAFSVMSNDRDFCDQLELSDRCTVFINLNDQSSDELCALLYSMSDR